MCICVFCVCVCSGVWWQFQGEIFRAHPFTWLPVSLWQQPEVHMDHWGQLWKYCQVTPVVNAVNKKKTRTYFFPQSYFSGNVRISKCDDTNQAKIIQLRKPYISETRKIHCFVQGYVYIAHDGWTEGCERLWQTPSFCRGLGRGNIIWSSQSYFTQCLKHRFFFLISVNETADAKPLLL